MPLTRIAPLVGVSRSATARSSVVLPQPEGPINETNSPRSTGKSMWLKACTGPSAVAKVSDKSAMSMTRSPAATFSVCFATGLSMSRAASCQASSNDAFGGGVLLPSGERPRLGGERIALDELAAAGLDLQLAVAPRHFAA